jgi:ADP-ribosylglycohydrolase
MTSACGPAGGLERFKGRLLELAVGDAIGTALEFKPRSLMRQAPVPMFYFKSPREAIKRAGESSRTTHGAQTAVDPCRYFAGLLVGALGGVDKDTLLSPRYCPLTGYRDKHPLHPEIAVVADGSFKEKDPPQIRGTGHVVNSLEAALWAFNRSSSFREAILLAVNLGDDAVTTRLSAGSWRRLSMGRKACQRNGVVCNALWQTRPWLQAATSCRVSGFGSGVPSDFTAECA